jgi:ATP-dependent helicase HrpA
LQNLLRHLEHRLDDDCLCRDRGALRKRLRGLQRRLRDGKPIDRGLDRLRAEVDASSARRRARRAELPMPEFPRELPVNEHREAIAAAIHDHQVVVVCGETGSGKTTQIPKICLSLGLGAGGMIGHTQPRRIAARSVAARISEELGAELGALVGYKVRFSDHLGPGTVVKLMTDGILLAETQGDPNLDQYEALIIDEAHERSLNVDFLLGYLHRLLPRRPGLKVIITSATIDPERFSRHFGDAPIIEVSGRTYPVEMRYRPLISEDEDERDRDLQQAILDAVDEVSRLGPGDILIFLSGEREIRETAESLRKHHPSGSEILPLYARLSASEQNRVFQPHRGRRIVLATNVAETSLTVPGIRYVIDPGYARISRYSYRSKVQRLPVEKISQASANQRAGRCGRVSAGVCVRLYSEEGFKARPEFTDPEILRTNLAAVVLQMCILKLGEVEDFPFVDPPDTRLVNDAFKLLFELGAVDEGRRVTELGRQLARLPVDPRLGRMVLAGRDQGCLGEMLTIAGFLAIQDPRERPLDHQPAADEKHRRFRDERSDFQAVLNLWDYYHEQARHLSKNKLRNLCRDDFLSYVRMREWQELRRQLHGLVTEMGMRLNDDPPEFDALHRALLSGLLGNLGVKQEDQCWLGARNRKFYIFPGSGLFKKGPKWLMAAELIETTRLYARTVAKINPGWIERLAPHLVKRSYGDPRWEARSAQVAASERVTLYGLPIVVGRKVNYGPVDPELAREIFIRHALVRQEYACRAPFFRHNRALVDEVRVIEAKARRRDVLADEEVLFRFYAQRLPAGIYNGPRFERWRKTAERDDPSLLFLSREILMTHEAETVTEERYPNQLELDGLRLPLSYRFEPGEPDDGVTVIVPLAALNQIDARRLEWLVPGLLESRMMALLKALPKALRKRFVPVPDYARALREALTPADGSLTEAMSVRLLRMTGVVVATDDWDPSAVPEHLKMNLRVVDPDGRILAEGRDLEAIRQRLRSRARESFAALPTPEYEREGLRDWDFGDLPEQVEFIRNGIALKGYPALVRSDDGSVALRLLDTPQRAEAAFRLGLCRLIELRARDKIRYLKRNLPRAQQMSLYFVGIGSQQALRDDLTAAIVDRAFLGDRPLPRNQADFNRCLEWGGSRLLEVADEVCQLVHASLSAYHDVRKRLNGELPLSWREAATDVREQLEQLIYVGFVSATPFEWLRHLPRYLKAVGLRLSKLDQQPDRDRQRFSQMAPLIESYRAQRDCNRAKGVTDPELELFRWMLEELRVSQFAQELGTSMPISLKRLESQWRHVSRQ